MELIIVTIGIGLSLVLNIVAIAKIQKYISHLEKAVHNCHTLLIDHVTDSLKVISIQMTEDNKKSRRQVAELRKQMSKNRVDIMNEVYAVQAMIQKEDKKREK